MANKNREHHDRSETVYESGSITTAQVTRGLEHRGHVATVHGYVTVLSTTQTYTDGTPYKVTFLEFMHGGRKHSRNYWEYFRPRTLVTLAREFAADVIARGGDNESNT